MYGSQEKILGQKVNVKFFTVDTYSVGTWVPRTFLELGKIQKNIFLNIKTSTIKSEKNIYQTIHSTSFIFNFFGILLFFLDFSGFFENLNSIFWKNYANFLTLPQTTMSNFWLVAQFSRDPGYVRVSGKLSNQSKIAPGGLWKRENIVSHEITLYHTMQMVLVDTCDKLIICFLWLLKGGKHNYWWHMASVVMFTTNHQPGPFA